MNQRQQVSLLFPGPASTPSARAGTPHASDLGLLSIERALDFDNRHSRFVAGVLSALETDPTVIEYRQAALRDLLALPALAEQFAAVLPDLYTLAEAGPGSRWRDNTPLPLVGARLADLEAYVSCIERMWHALTEARQQIQAEAWLDLLAMLEGIRALDEYSRLAASLPQLRAQLDQAGSVTLGINLDGQLQPESATVLSVNPGRFSGKGGVIERLLGDRHAADTVRGISALYKANENQKGTPEHELFQDLARLLERVVGPVATALQRFTQVNAAPLVALVPELVFYLGACRLHERLAARGLPLCFPQIAKLDEAALILRETYSVDLALRSGGTEIVPNTIMFDSEASILLLTGPNSGGKTTYARALAQAQVMAQAGLFVAGSVAKLQPVDGVWSHFATAERPGGSGGRLAEELERLAGIFAHATGQSLIILNEPLTSTDTRSARVLALDMVAGLKLLGANTLFVTHLHELCEDLVPHGDTNDGVRSLIAVAATNADGKQDAPTYRVVRGRPQISAYARELARQFKLDKDQLEQSLLQRLNDNAVER